MLSKTIFQTSQFPLLSESPRHIKKGFLVMNLNSPTPTVETRQRLNCYNYSFGLADPTNLKGSIIRHSAKLFTQLFPDATQTPDMIANRQVMMKMNPENLVVKDLPKSILHPWIIPTGDTKRTILMEIWAAGNKDKTYNIKRFLTGGCLFSSYLTGSDQLGRTHPLTDFRYQFPENTLIDNVKAQDQFHPYEMMLFRQLDTLIYLMKAINKDSFIEYHLPREEYLLSGIDMYLKGQMTKKALNLYHKEVQLRSIKHKEILQEISEEHNIKISPKSPLECIFSNLTASQDPLDYLINRLNLTSREQEILHNSSDFLSRSSILYNKVLACLINPETNNAHYKIWRDAKLEKSEDELRSLGELNRDSYVCMAAQVCALGAHGETAVIDEMSEKKIGLEYKRRFSAQYGALLCMHWLPSLFFSTNPSYNPEENHMPFHLNVQDHMEKLEELYKNGILDHSLSLLHNMYSI